MSYSLLDEYRRGKRAKIEQVPKRSVPKQQKQKKGRTEVRISLLSLLPSSLFLLFLVTLLLQSARSPTNKASPNKSTTGTSASGMQESEKDGNFLSIAQ